MPPPSSIQPGGGVCVALERAWGNVRRALLRSLRPGYVREITAKRQGSCADCPHDIIDARDLKYWRPTCGYWFREEDDPFLWRGRLGLARVGLAEVILSTLFCLGLFVALGIGTLLWRHWAFLLGIAPVGLLWFQLVYFFRDPPRTVPTDPEALLSPADGTVTHVDEVDAPDFPGGRAFRISIYLSLWTVHLNRLPRSGRVVALQYFPGAFLNARHRECVQRNEQLWTDLLEPNGRRVRIKQISGFAARRLVCWLRLNEEVRAGDRYGMIKFGSRTDVLVPTGEARNLFASVGDRVTAGTTVLLRYREKK